MRSLRARIRRAWRGVACTSQHTPCNDQKFSAHSWIAGRLVAAHTPIARAVNLDALILHSLRNTPIWRLFSCLRFSSYSTCYERGRIGPEPLWLLHLLLFLLVQNQGNGHVGPNPTDVSLATHPWSRHFRVIFQMIFRYIYGWVPSVLKIC